MVNKKFSVSTYGHSEEAFISYLQSGGDAIISPDIVPQGVMFLIISTIESLQTITYILSMKT